MEESESEQSLHSNASRERSRCGNRGLLLRKCECGNHTVAGGQCSECGKEKNKWQSPGNRSSFGMSFSLPRISLQPKLIVGPVDDPLELEADRIADHVTAPGPVSATAPHIQRYSTQSTGHSEAAPASVGNALAGPGYQLDPSFKTRYGDALWVRLYPRSSALRRGGRAICSRSERRAYTVGDHIVFGRDNSHHTARRAVVDCARIDARRAAIEP